MTVATVASKAPQSLLTLENRPDCSVQAPPPPPPPPHPWSPPRTHNGPPAPGSNGHQMTGGLSRGPKPALSTTTPTYTDQNFLQHLWRRGLLSK